MHIVVAMLCLLASRVNTAAVDNKYLEAKGVTECPEDIEDASECIKTIINVLMPQLRTGSPELGLQPYDPIVIDRLSFQYASGAVSGRISVRNVTIGNFADTRVQKINLKVNGDKAKIKLVTKVPKLLITGSYKADMLVNSLQLKPKGEFNVTIFDLENHIVVDGEFYSKDGHRFIRLTDIDANPKIRDMIIKANGIFADPELDELALNVANSYWRDIYGIIVPETRSSWAPVLLRVSNEALKHVPIDQFFKKSP